MAAFLRVGTVEILLENGSVFEASEQLCKAGKSLIKCCEAKVKAGADLENVKDIADTARMFFKNAANLRKVRY